MVPEAEQGQVMDVVADVVEGPLAADLAAGAVVLATAEDVKVHEIEPEAVRQPDVGIDVIQVAVEPPEQEMEGEGNIDLHIALRLQLILDMST